MLETLMNLVRQQSGDAIVNNPAVPNERNEDAMQSVMDGILGGMQQQATGGNLGGLLGTMMGQQQTSMHNPVVNGIAGNVVGNLTQRLGLSPQVAGMIASTVVPMVLSRLSAKAQDPNDHSVDMGGLMAQATGRQEASGIDWSRAAQSAMADGRLDMNDLMRMMGGGGAGPSQQGGLGGMLGNILGGR